MNTPIYLDNNATTLLAEEVAEALRAGFAEGYANPASQHRWGRKARARLEDARERIAGLLDCRLEDRVIFCSSGTEANNTALRGIPGHTPAVVVASRLEHPSIQVTAERLDSIRFRPLKAHSDGRIDVEHLEQLLAEGDVSLVSVMLANHETGVLQPIDEVAGRCRSHGVLFHCDASQAIGKIEFSFSELAADAVTVSPHKFHGPRGIAALVVKSGVSITPLLHGGTQQFELRPATEDVALAMAFERALELAVDLSAVSRIRERRDDLESQLRASHPELVIAGGDAPRLANTSCIAFPGMDRQAMLMALDLAGVACSTGSACTSGSSEPSPVLTAMGLEKSLIEGALRFSLSRLTSDSEVKLAAQRISSVYKNLRQQKEAEK